MELIHKDISYRSRSQTIELIGLGDIHLGNVGCDKAGLKNVIDYIKETPYCYWIGMGDFLDCITPNDKRFDPYSIDEDYNIKDLSKLITKQKEDIKNLFAPIKHKCICLLTGNHEEKVRKTCHRDITYELCYDLNVRYGGYSSFIRLNCIRQGTDNTILTIYANHGFGSSRRDGPKINRLEDTMTAFDADIVMLAHEHKKIATPPVVKFSLPHRNELKLISRTQIGVMTGSFLKGYIPGSMSYVEQKGYHPADIGIVKIKIRPHQKERFTIEI